MNSIIFSQDSSNLSVEQLLQHAQGGGVQLKDADGQVLAFVLSPADHEALTYVEAGLELLRNAEDIQEALGRSGGVTTTELLDKAASSDSASQGR